MVSMLDLKNALFEGGVVGAGGAGFPTHAKLSDQADTVILNCAECEPLIKVDRQLMVDYINEIDFLAKREIHTVFHYVPLHSAPAGQKFGRFHGEDKYTTKESERLLRLPMYYQLKEEDQEQVVKAVKEFYE